MIKYGSEGREVIQLKQLFKDLSGLAISSFVL
jgi:hypothetical protein